MFTTTLAAEEGASMNNDLSFKVRVCHYQDDDLDSQPHATVIAIRDPEPEQTRTANRTLEELHSQLRWFERSLTVSQIERAIRHGADVRLSEFTKLGED